MKVLEKKSKTVIDWFKMNDMMVNPGKFQAMIMRCNKKVKRKENDLKINNPIIISSVDFVTILFVSFIRE